MPKRLNSTVVDGYLELQDDNDRIHPHIPVGSREWFNWLAKHKGFAYQDETGGFTARCEQIKGRGAYWYAYRRTGKKVRKKYLGKAEKLTQQRLNLIAVRLAEDSGAAISLPYAAGMMPPPVVGSLVADETTLLSTKFIPPNLPAQLVGRPRLTNQLNVPIVYVSAPAGYGKSTLISQWLRQGEFPFIWVGLEESDDDQVQFWRVVFAAIKQMLPQILPTGVHTKRTTLTELINNFQQIEYPHYLVLDDFHHINNKAIQEDVAFLLEHMPPQLQVIFTSRTQTPFNVGRWRAKGRYVDLNANDLRFTPQEGVAFLAQMPDLDHHEMLTLVAQMEGWVTGLQLVSLAMRRQGDVRKYLSRPEKSFAYFKTYLHEDVFQREQEDVQTFLLQISILRTLNIDLCKTVTGREDAATVLAYLERENLFITAVPEQPGWYRLHQLFAEILADQLLTVLPEKVMDLHLKAARWYKVAGITENAVRHLLAAQAWEEAAALIETHAPALFLRGEVARLMRWLEGVPLSVLQNHQLLMLTYARLSSDSLPEVIRRLRQDSDGQYPSDNNEMAADVSQLIDYLADMDLALPEEEKTADSNNTYHHIWHEIDLMLRSLSYWMAGDWQSAEELLTQAITHGARYGHTYITWQAAGMLAAQHVRQGRLQQAEKIIQQVSQQSQRPISQLSSSLITVQCNIYYERNQLIEAYHLLTAELARIDAQRQYELYLRSRLILAHVLCAMNKFETAETMMAAIVSESRQKSMSWLPSAELEAYQAYIWLQNKKMSRAEDWLQRSGLQISDELRQENSFGQLVHAHILIRQEKWAAASQLLLDLITSFPHGLRTEPYLKLLLPLAMALFGQRQINQALQTLRQGLMVAVTEGYKRPFLDQGPNMFTLLTMVSKQGQVSQEIQQHIALLLYVLGQSRIDIPTLTPTEMSALVTAASITVREQELMRLVAQGLSNREISQRLIITINTVKSHLRRIYLKLEVQNRAQAVMKAQELNLL